VSVVALASVLGANGALAQAAGDCITPPPGGPADTEICNLGTLDGGNYTRADDVNADGTVVVGWSNSSSGFRAFRWVEGSTAGDPGNPQMESLGLLAGGTFTVARGVNADGTVVVGEGDTPAGNRAFRWVEGGAGMENLGTLTGGSRSDAYAVNADGSVVVGYSESATGHRAFRWVAGGTAGDAGNPQMENLGTLTGGIISYAYGVNADGNVVAGYSHSTTGVHAFRWVAGGTAGDASNPEMEDLGTLTGGDTSYGLDINADGSVVVGYSNSTEGERAFRWVAGGTTGDVGNPQMENLGVLDGGTWSHAFGVNADGSVVVGRASTPTGTRAFRWVEGGTAGDAGNPQMENLGTLTGGIYSMARSVSADGSIVVGESGSAAGDRAFIWRGAMQDFTNLIASFPVLANDSAVAAAQQQGALGQIIGQGFLAGAGQIGLRLHGGYDHTAQNPTTVGARSAALGAVSFGYGVSDVFTLGATASFAGTSLANNGFDMQSGAGLAAWGRFSAGGAAGTGLQASAALGWSRADGEITRGRLLADVDLATGSTALQSWGLTAQAGYGMEFAGVLVTPFAAIAHFQTTRAAYTEAGASFNATYDAMDVSRTDLTLGVTAEIAIGAQGRLSLGAGVERTLGTPAAVLTGTSDIPGMTTFSIPGDFVANRTRAYASAGYSHDFGNGFSVAGDLRVGQAVYGTSPDVRGGVTVGFTF
jgi:probable HAF family extracellular repeat protein